MLSANFSRKGVFFALTEDRLGLFPSYIKSPLDWSWPGLGPWSFGPWSLVLASANKSKSLADKKSFRTFPIANQSTKTSDFLWKIKMPFFHRDAQIIWRTAKNLLSLIVLFVFILKRNTFLNGWPHINPKSIKQNVCQLLTGNLSKNLFKLISEHPRVCKFMVIIIAITNHIKVVVEVTNVAHDVWDVTSCWSRRWSNYGRVSILNLWPIYL